MSDHKHETQPERIERLRREEAAHDRACWAQDMRAEEWAVQEYLRKLDQERE